MHTVYKQHRTGMIVEVLFKTQKNIMFVVKHKSRNVIHENNEELLYPLSVFENNFDKYIEPRKEYFCAFKNGIDGLTEFSGPHIDRRFVEGSMLKHKHAYGFLVMTHHSETEVTVEFHLKR